MKDLSLEQLICDLKSGVKKAEEVFAYFQKRIEIIAGGASCPPKR